MAERRYLITVPALPGELDARELLELVLAGASLDLPLTVVFSGDAIGLLRGAGALAWLQLAEQGLAGLAVVDPRAGEPGLPPRVQLLDAEGLEAMRAASLEIRA